MALISEAKQAYMQRRRRETATFVWEAKLREERALMKKALHRVRVAERWKSEHPEEQVDECLLSLAYHWNQLQEEERMKRQRRDKKAVAIAFGAPQCFQSLP